MSPKRAAGTSLIELMVSLALVGLITLVAGALMRHGASYLKNTTAQVDLQRGALLALNWMARDIGEASPVAIHTNSWGTPPVPHQPPIAGPPRGVVLASPRDVNGQVSYSGSAIDWNSRLCYFLDLADNGKLYRVIEPHPPEPLPLVIDPTTEDTDHFQTELPNLSHRLLAQQISYLDIQRQAAGVQITLEAATPDRRFSILVTTLVHPKN